MRRNGIWFAIVFMLLAACTTKPAAPAASENPPGGTWSGDYSLDSDRREPIRVDLRWEGGNLRGTVHAGPRSLPLTKASFTPETGAITMEFDTQGNNGQTVHYMVEGKVEGNTMTGKWTHDGQRGDFRVSRE